MAVTPSRPQLPETLAVSVEDASQVASVRRAASQLATLLALDDGVAGRVALVATELSTNLIKHAGRGEVLLTADGIATPRFVQILALDHGPGMANVDRCFEDGFSTTASPGTGLGAVRRLANSLDVYSHAGGTAILARVGTSGASVSRPASVAGLRVACRGEEHCGDAWDQELRGSILTLLVSDGLGHGAGATDAAEASVCVFRDNAGAPPAARVEALHAALRATRGAALAVAEIDVGRRVVRFSGLGNITATVYGDGPARHLVSHHGTAGHAAHKVAEYSYPWPARGVLVMHSDGLTTVRDLDSYPGLMSRDPGIIAGVLYRDFSRRRDDVTVVAARGAA